MKKNMRVVQINGFRGLLLALFIVSCLIAGFIAFPSFVTMSAWNHLSAKTGSFPVINFGQGILLWAIIAFSVYIFSKKKFIVSFNSQQELTEDEVKDVISKIRSHSINRPVLLPKDITREVTKDLSKDLQKNLPKNLDYGREFKEEVEAQAEQKEG